MKKVLLILGLVLLLSVVEQTAGQYCSLKYCRNQPASNCRCRGCCYGRYQCNFGSCAGHNLNGQWVLSCFCSSCPGPRSTGAGGNETIPY